MDRVQVRGDGLPEMGEGMQELWIHPLPDSLLQARGWGMQGYHFFDQPDGRKVQALVSSPGKWGLWRKHRGRNISFQVSWSAQEGLGNPQLLEARLVPGNSGLFIQPHQPPSATPYPLENVYRVVTLKKHPRWSLLEKDPHMKILSPVEEEREDNQHVNT